MVPVASPSPRVTSEGAQDLLNGSVAVPTCAARFHTTTGARRPASAYLQASSSGSSQSYSEPGTAVNKQLPQLVLRGPEEPASSYEGYDADLPEEARGDGTASGSEMRLHSITVDDDVRAIQERQERREKLRQARYAANGAGMPSTSASQESTRQQRRQTAVAGQQLRAGNEIDLICESLAFGGQVGNTFHPDEPHSSTCMHGIPIVIDS